MAIFLSVFLISLLVNAPGDYEQWRTRMANPVVNLATILFWGALLAHAWVGMRDVLMDYVHKDATRFALLTLVWMLLAAIGVWVLRIMLTVAG